jgi:hypothetical protein
MVRPKRVWGLPNETIRQFDSGLLNTWWSKAVADAHVSIEGNITAYSHRSGSATSAFKLGVPVPVICQIADWDTTGRAFMMLTTGVTFSVCHTSNGDILGTFLPRLRRAGPSYRTDWFLFKQA